jgi:hypothetical protein
MTANPENGVTPNQLHMNNNATLRNAMQTPLVEF